MRFLSVLLISIVMISGIVSASSFSDTISKIRCAGYEIKATKIVIAKEFIKEKEILNQNIDYHSRKRIEFIKELFPFFKNKEGLAVIDAISESPDLWTMKECVDVLSEQLFNERFSDREAVLKKLNELKNRIESEPADEARDWSQDYSKAFDYFNKRDYANAIIYFKKSLPGLESTIASSSGLPPYVLSSMKMQAVMGYWSLGVSYEYVTPPKEQYYYTEAKTAFLDSLNKYPLALPTMIPGAYGCLCRVYYFEKNWDKAIEYLNLAAKANPVYNEGKPLKYYDLSLAEIQMGQSPANYDKALVVINKEIANFKPSEENPPQNAEVMHYNRAVIYASKGMIKEARADIEKVNTYYNMAHSANEKPLAKDERELYKRRAEALKTELDNMLFIIPNPPFPVVSHGGQRAVYVEVFDGNGNAVNITGAFKIDGNPLAEIYLQGVNGNKANVVVRGIEKGLTALTFSCAAGTKKGEKIIPLAVAYRGGEEKDKPPYKPVDGGIDLASGNFSFTRTDYSIPKQGIPFHFTRIYDSLAPDATTEITLGTKWTFNYNARLQLYDISTKMIYFIDETNTRIDFYNDLENAALYKTSNPDYLYIEVKGLEYWLYLKNKEVIKFNAAGHITEINTPVREVMKFEYIQTDFSGVKREILSKVTDMFGRTMSLTYNKDKRVETVVFNPGQTIRYNYDIKGNLVEVVHPGGQVEKYTYNAKNQIAKLTTFGGSEFTYNYDDAGKIVSLTDPYGKTKKIAYEKGKSSVTDPNGNISAAELNSIGAAKSSILPDKSTVGYDWDKAYNLTGVTDPKAQATKFSYDSSMNLAGVTDPLKNEVKFQYEPKYNLPSAVTDKKGKKTEMTYDEFGRMTQNVSPLKDTTVYKYENAALFGYLTSVVESDGVTTTTKYDSFGYPSEKTRIKDKVSVTSKFVYNSRGMLSSSTDSSGAVTKYEYDAIDRLVKIINPDASEKLFEYDIENRLIAKTDELKNRTQYAYDKLGRLVSVTLPDNAKTQYEYDANSNLVKVTKADGSILKYAYNSRNKVIKETDEKGAETSFEYDANGNLLKAKKPKGNYVTFSYDFLNRVTKKTFFRPPDVADYEITYTYDANGNVTAVKSGNTSVEYAYNDINQMLSEKSPGTITTAFTYNTKGMPLTELSDYVNKSYTYDPINRISEMKANGLSYKYSYDTAGRIAEFSQNGVLSKYTYDISSRVTNRTTALNNALIEKYEYKYDSAGKRVYEKEESDKNPNTYAFDAAGRIAKATYEDGNLEEFKYNLLGERISKKTLTDTEEIYAYDTNGQLTGTTSIKKRSFTYDANGNISGKTVSKMIDNRMVVENTRYEFNSRDLLARIVLPDNKAVEYDYDAFGRRISIKYDGKTRRIIYSGDNKVAEFNEDKKTQYVYGSGTDQILSLTRDGKNHHFLRGTANSSGKIIDSAGATQKEYRYRAFGEIYGQTGEFENDITFTSRELDEIAGIYYYRARFYDPEIGRFLSRDPHPASISNPYDFNKYMYCGNDPINSNDPYGLEGFWYDNLAEWAMNTAENLKKPVFDNTSSSLGVLGATLYGSAVDYGMGALMLPSSIGHLGEGAGEFSVTPSLENTMLLAQDVATVASVLSMTKLAIQSKNVSSGICFTEETQIKTEKGYKCIKDIVVGDKVFSKNTETNESGLKQVTKTFVRETNRIVYLTLENGILIKTTEEHPFWVNNEGWKTAKELKKNDALLLLSGKEINVKNIKIVTQDQFIKVYNFEVSDWHTYFITNREILVHNACQKKIQKGKTPMSNQAQNKQYKGAVIKIEKEIGRKISADENTLLHDETSGQGFGFWEIVEEGLRLFKKK